MLSERGIHRSTSSRCLVEGNGAQCLNAGTQAAISGFGSGYGSDNVGYLSEALGVEAAGRQAEYRYADRRSPSAGAGRSAQRYG